MNPSVYVREAVTFCSLGNTPEEIVKQCHHVADTKVKLFAFGSETKQREYRGMNIQSIAANDEFYGVFERLLSQLIQQSNLTSEELLECALLVGSTSMNIPCSEVFFRQNNGEKMLSGIGYGAIGDELSKLFSIGGEISFFTTACTSSSNALLYAQRGVESGRFQRAIVLGFEFYNELTIAGFETLGLLSLNGCRPFDADRSGIVLGEGCSAILVDSIASSYSTQIILRGGASRCDIASPTSHSTDGSMVARTIHDALQDTNLTLPDVMLIKAHGTGTDNNDWAEGRGINLAFPVMPPLIGLKPLLGHTLGGCGAIELSVLWFCMREGFLPKTYGFENLDERAGITPMIEETIANPGIILLNHFGFGGSGVVLVVEMMRESVK